LIFFFMIHAIDIFILPLYTVFAFNNIKQLFN